MYSHRIPNVCFLLALLSSAGLLCFLQSLYAVLFCSPFQLSWITSFRLFFMYPTLLYYGLLWNLFVVCLCLCLPNPIWGCYVPGPTHTQWQYSIRVCIILLCFSFCLWLTTIKKKLKIHGRLCSHCQKYFINIDCEEAHNYPWTMMKYHSCVYAGMKIISDV